MNGKIYMLHNKLNNKLYIGQTVDKLSVRFNKHVHTANNSLTYKAIKKYGKQNFDMILLEDGHQTLEELNEAETFFIQYFRSRIPNGYNIDHGGNGRGKMAEETKKKISVANSGQRNGMYGVRILGNKNRLGKTHSAHTKEKISRTLSKTLKGIDRSGPKNSNYGNRKINVTQIAEILSLNQQGLSFRRIANLYNVSESTIYTTLKRNA